MTKSLRSSEHGYRPPNLPPDPPKPQRRRIQGLTIVGLVLTAIGLAFVASLQEYSLGQDRDERLYNTDRSLAPDRETMEFLGLGDGFWCTAIVIIVFATGAMMFTIFWRHWKRNGRVHPGVALYVVLTVVGLSDPFFNWTMYCNYNPKMLHGPTDWPYLNLSPLVEPLWIFPGYSFYYLMPAIGCVAAVKWWWRRRAAQGRPAPRHELWTLFAFGTAVGLAFDAIVETIFINMGLYQFIRWWGPALSIEHSDLPVSEIVLLGATVGLCTMLMHTNDRGESVCSELARKHLARGEDGVFSRRKGLAEATSAMMIMVIWFTGYIGFYATMRLSDHQNNFGDDWHYPVAKVYDPDGKAAEHGIEGPYYKGVWAVPD